MNISYGRHIVTFIFVAVLIVTLTFNGLAGPGLGPFNRSTGNISADYETCLTPAGFTFSIWGIIYLFLTLIAIYSIVNLFRKVDDVPSYTLGSVFSTPLLLVLILNLLLNITWLFLWDNALMIWASVFLILIAVTNGIVMVLAVRNVKESVSSLRSASPVDLWLGVLTMNGLATYATWTLLAAFLNFSITLVYDAGADESSVCIGILVTILSLSMIFQFFENTKYAVYVNTVLTHYAVLLWAFIGIYSKNSDYDHSAVNILLLANLIGAAITLTCKILMTVYRAYKDILFTPVSWSFKANAVESVTNEQQSPLKSP